MVNHTESTNSHPVSHGSFESSFLLSCNLPLHPPSITYLISAYIYSSFKIVPPYAHRKQLYQLDYNAYVHIQSYSLHSFLNLLLPSPFLPTLLSKVMSYIHDTVRLCCHCPCFILECPDLLTEFLQFVYIKVYSCVLKFYVVWKCRVS